MFLVPILGTMVGIMIFFNIWHMEAAMFDFLEVNCGLRSFRPDAFATSSEVEGDNALMASKIPVRCPIDNINDNEP